MGLSHFKALNRLFFIAFLAAIFLVAIFIPMAMAERAGFFAFYPWTGAEANQYQSFANNTDKIRYISPMWYLSNDGRGTIQGEVGDHNMLELARAKGVKVLPNLYNWSEEGWDQEKVHSLLSTPSYRDNFINNVYNLVTGNAFEGITLDLENLSATDRDDYTALVRDLARKLHSSGKMLALAVPAKTSDSPDNDWGYPFDYPSLGNYADIIFIMAYDEHWTAADPGPVASLGFIQQVSSYAKNVIPPSKLVMGLPFYGYDFKTSPPVSKNSLSYLEILDLSKRVGAAVSYHSSFRVPYFLYTQNGQNHQVWFENAQSFREKYEVIANSGLGSGAFVLGFEDPEVWNVLPKNSSPPNAGPGIKIISPNAGANVSSPLTIEVTTEGEIQATEVKLYVDQVLIAILGSPPYYITWNALGLSEGYHQLVAEATGPNQNVYKEIITFYYQKPAAAPNPDLFYPQDNSLTTEISNSPGPVLAGDSVSSETGSANPQPNSGADGKNARGKTAGDYQKPTSAPERTAPPKTGLTGGIKESKEPGPRTHFLLPLILFLVILRLKILC